MKKLVMVLFAVLMMTDLAPAQYSAMYVDHSGISGLLTKQWRRVSLARFSTPIKQFELFNDGTSDTLYFTYVDDTTKVSPVTASAARLMFPLLAGESAYIGSTNVNQIWIRSSGAAIPYRFRGLY